MTILFVHNKQRKKTARKFIDPNPSNRVVFGTSGTGPDTKNFARLKDPDNELRRKEAIGKASGLSQSTGVRNPVPSTGKIENDSITMANDMCD